jgi:hypothetical protein
MLSSEESTLSDIGDAILTSFCVVGEAVEKIILLGNL